MSSGSFNFFLQDVFTNDTYLIIFYEEYFALDDLQWLIFHETKPNQTKPKLIFLIYKQKENLTLNNLHRLICHKTKPYIFNIYICIKRTWH